MNSPKEMQIAQLLADTQNAHHHYQETQLNGEYNLKWADWFADYLIDHGLGNLLGREVAPEMLAQKLNELDRRQRAEAPEEDWPIFYARHMIA